MRALSSDEMAEALKKTITQEYNHNEDSANTLGSKELSLLYPDLTKIFEGSIKQANMDIKMGEDSDKFFQLTILNFLIRCVISGYSKADAEDFLRAYLGDINGD